MRLPSESSRVAPGGTPAAAAVAGLLALAVAMGIGRFAFTPILPLMQDDAGVSVAQGGWLAAANYAGYFLGALWAMAQPARAHRAIRGALLAIGFSTLGMGLTQDLAAWLVLRAVAGVASAWALIHVSAWCLERLAALGKPVLNAAVFSGVGWGILFAGGLCLALARIGAGSTHAWISLGVVSLAVAALIWPLLGGNGVGLQPWGASKGRHSWSADGLRLVLCYGAFGFGYIIPATFLPLMAKQAIKDTAVFGWAWPVFGLTAALSTLLVAALAHALGNRRLWIGAAIAMAVGVAAPGVLPGLGAALLAAILVGGTFMVITMVAMQEAKRVAGRDAPVVMGAMTSAFAAGQILGPLSVSSMVDPQGDFSAALLVAALLLALSAIALAVRSK